jgi:hypothetical protein
MADGRPHKPRLKDGVLGRPLSSRGTNLWKRLRLPLVAELGRLRSDHLPVAPVELIGFTRCAGLPPKTVQTFAALCSSVRPYPRSGWRTDAPINPV